jgi:hypothetical protein
MGLPLRLPQKKQIFCGCPVQKKAFAVNEKQESRQKPMIFGTDG